MGNAEPPSGDDSQGFHTVWRAPDAATERPVTCAHCHAEIGTVRETEVIELFCTHCQAVHRVTGRAGAPPAIECLGQRAIIKGEGKLGHALRGEHPDVPPWWTAAPGQIVLWLLILLALALFLYLR